MKQTIPLSKVVNRPFYPLLTLLTLVNLLSFSYLSLAQTIRYVSTTGTNTNPATATSWATATTSLQGAIDASATGDQVWVAAGTYKPATVGTTNGKTNRLIAFAMKNNVAIYGGFAASGNPSFSGRQSATYPTILSGDIDNNNVQDDANSYQVIHNSGLNSSALLDGFTITGGRAYGGGLNNNSEGGGVFNENSSPRFVNCIISGNQAFYGAGIANESSSSPTLVNCLIAGNSAFNTGGGFYNDNSSPHLVNCTIAGNTAGGSGWAILEARSATSLVNCIVWNNGADKAIRLVNSNPVSTQYCLIEPGATDYQGDNNIVPLTSFVSPFVSPTDLHLASCSVAIDAGDLASTNSGPIDLAGNPRFYATSRIDLGAYEFQGSAALTTITSQPLSATTVGVGVNLSISVGTSGSANAYQWYRDGALIKGQTTATLTLSNVQLRDEGFYRLVVSSPCTSLTSNALNLTVQPVPDLTPILYVRPASMYGTQAITYVVDLVEVGGSATSGVISVKVSQDARISLSLPTGMNNVGNRSVQNSVWSISGPVGGYYTLNTNQVIVAGERLSFGLTGTLTPGATSGGVTVSVVIGSGSGGENTGSNNIDTERIDYFQQ